MTISAFGVEHDGGFSKRQRDPERSNKVFGSPAKTAAVVGGGSALLLGRTRANNAGLAIAARAQGRAAWSAGRAHQMPNGRLKRLRLKYAEKLDSASTKGPVQNQDVREWTARTAVAGVTGGAAGGAVYGRKQLTPREPKGKK